MENDTAELLSQLEVNNADKIFATYLKQVDLPEGIKMEIDIIVGMLMLQYTAIGMASFAHCQNPDIDENELFLDICNSYKNGLEDEALRITKSKFTVIDGNKGKGEI